MKFKHKIDKFVSTLSERISSGGVSQLEVQAEGERDIFGNMPALARKAAAEGIVLLKNNNALPYKLDTKISVFGRCQLDYFYVGYGSGGDVNAPYFVNVIDGIKNAGGHVNEWLLEYYKDFTKNNPAPHGFWGHWPMNFEEPSLDDKMIERASEESDVALVVIGRAAGEDRENTLTKGSYYLTDEERNLLDNVCNHFSNVTVLLDCGNIIDMQWVLDYEERLRGIIYAWQGGMESGNAIADVLFGRVNPSGRLTDTIAVRYEDYPSAMHFGNKLFNTYVEDIFVGYRYFETFSKEKALFPFGYGLSYTNFDIEVLDFKADNDKIKVEVRVTNIGDVAGKEVVELYANAPQGKLSKPVMSLVAFDKTINLEPKESQKITLEVPVYLLASFDDTGATGHKYSYILEKGEYKFFIGENVRDLDEAGSFELKEDIVLEELEAVCAPKEYMDRIVAFKVNGSFIPKKVALKPEKPYLRKRILDNLPKEIGHVVHNYNFSQVKSGEISVEKFISSLTNQELEALTRGEGGMDSSYGVTGNAGAFGGIIPELNKKGVPAVITTDGPAGIRIRKYTSLLPCGTALASTFNTRLVEELCSEMGKELKNAAGVNQGALRGTAVHRVMECLDFKSLCDIDTKDHVAVSAFVKKSMDEMLKKGLITDDMYRLTRPKLIEQFISSDVAARMAQADKRGDLYKEKPFVMDYEGVLVQGIIDVFWLENDKIVLLDYKTDRVNAAKELIDRYSTQLKLYADALGRIFSTDGKSIQADERLIYSFRLQQTIVTCREYKK